MSYFGTTTDYLNILIAILRNSAYDVKCENYPYAKGYSGVVCVCLKTWLNFTSLYLSLSLWKVNVYRCKYSDVTKYNV